MFCGKCRTENAEDNSYCVKCGADLRAMKTPPRFDRLDMHVTEYKLPANHVLSGRYEIQRELGAGGLGIVYLAHDRSLEMDVAIKVLQPILARDPEAVNNLRKEARIAMSLAHPNIMRVHNFEDHPETKFLTMEYIDGMTLAQKKLGEASGRLPLDLVIEYVKQICQGLGYAHALKIVHRDVKPANIMVTLPGLIKITDFGIARVAKDSVSRLSNVMTSGTLLYMSPEQIKGKGADAQSDIYSLGATIYELLAGHPPFHSGGIEYQILHEPPEPIAGVPDRINALVLKALEKEKEKRWKQTRELSEAFEEKIQVKVDPIIEREAEKIQVKVDPVIEREVDKEERRAELKSPEESKPDQPLWLEPSRRSKLIRLFALSGALGWLVSWTLTPNPAPILSIPDTLVRGTVVGAFIGIAQWFILRRYGKAAMSWWWILASTVGGAGGDLLFRYAFIGTVFSYGLPDHATFIPNTVTGVFVGTVQWLILRRYVKAAAWWILACLAIWAVISVPFFRYYNIFIYHVIRMGYGAGIGAAQALCLSLFRKK